MTTNSSRGFSILSLSRLPDKMTTYYQVLPNINYLFVSINYFLRRVSTQVKCLLDTLKKIPVKPIFHSSLKTSTRIEEKKRVNYLSPKYPDLNSPNLL